MWDFIGDDAEEKICNHVLATVGTQWSMYRTKTDFFFLLPGTKSFITI